MILSSLGNLLWLLIFFQEVPISHHEFPNPEPVHGYQMLISFVLKELCPLASYHILPWLWWWRSLKKEDRFFPCSNQHKCDTLASKALLLSIYHTVPAPRNSIISRKKTDSSERPTLLSEKFLTLFYTWQTLNKCFLSFFRIYFIC